MTPQPTPSPSRSSSSTSLRDIVPMDGNGDEDDGAYTSDTSTDSQSPGRELVEEVMGEEEEKRAYRERSPRSRKPPPPALSRVLSGNHLAPPPPSSIWRNLSRSPSPLGLIPIHRTFSSLVSLLRSHRYFSSPAGKNIMISRANMEKCVDSQT